MSNPTFNSVELCTTAREAIGQPQVRVYTETVPGASGAYVQTHGKGPRQITVEGVLYAPGGDFATAVVALKTLLRTKQALADGATVATYVGEDAHSYANCLLMSYDHVGRPWSKVGGACYNVRAVVVELDP